MGDGNRLFERKELIVCLIFAISVTVSVIAEDAPWSFIAGGTFPECPPNEFYRACRDNCSNCEFKGKCPITECTQSGCDCRPHFVRLTPDGPCEPVRKCPKPACQENEIFRPCGPICETCARLRCRVLNCEYKCYCKEGYLRSNEGKCILENECSPRTRCSIGEEKGKSGLVDEYCLHEEGHIPSNDTENKERCYCMEEHKRNLMGHCSDEFFCQFNKCRNVEQYQSCPPRCNTTCYNYGDSNCEEDGQCYPGCFCPKGFVMNDNRGCVRVEECPPGSNPFAATAAPTTLGSTTETSFGDASTPMTTHDITPSQGQGTTGDQSDSTGTTPGISTNAASSTTPKPKVSKKDKSNLRQKNTKGKTVSTGVTVSSGVTVSTGVTVSSGVTVPTGVTVSSGITVSTGVTEEMEDLKKLSLVTPDFEEQNL